MISTSQIIDLPVSNGQFPKECPKAIPLPFDFTASSSYSLDLTNIQQRAVIGYVQTVFIENSVNTAALTIVFGTSGQVIICPAKTQGYFPVLAPNPVRFTVTSNGGTTATIYLINAPVQPGLWSVTGLANSYAGDGSLIVSEPTLDGAIVSGQIQSLGFKVGHNGTIYPAWIGNGSLFGAITASAANVLAGNPGYFITSINLSLSPGATQAVAGDWTVILNDSSSGVVEEFAFFVPSAAPALTQANTINVNAGPGFVWNNKTANSNLSVNLSAALTAGKLYYNIGYGITPIVN